MTDVARADVSDIEERLARLRDKLNRHDERLRRIMAGRQSPEAEIKAAYVAGHISVSQMEKALDWWILGRGANPSEGTAK